MSSRHCSESRCAARALLESPRESRSRSRPACEACMVGIKRVVDYNVRVRVKPDGSGMATEGLEDEHQPVRRDRDRGGSAPQRIAVRSPKCCSSRSARRRRAAAAHGLGDGRRSRDARRRAGRARASDRRARVARRCSPRAAGPRAARQARRRRRSRPDRPDVGGALGPAAGDVRVAARDRRRLSRPSRARSTPASRRSRSTCRPSSRPTCA